MDVDVRQSGVARECPRVRDAVVEVGALDLGIVEIDKLFWHQPFRRGGISKCVNRPRLEFEVDGDASRLEVPESIGSTNWHPVDVAQNLLSIDEAEIDSASSISAKCNREQRLSQRSANIVEPGLLSTRFDVVQAALSTRQSWISQIGRVKLRLTNARPIIPSYAESFVK